MPRSYKPSVPFNVPMKLLIPVDSNAYGTGKKTFPNPDEVPDDCLFYGSVRSFGGTENFKDNVYTIIATATIETWFRPDIKADCRIYLCDTGEVYDIKGEPEDINFRHQYLSLKVQKVGGKP